MKINQQCDLFLSDLFSYDIRSCYYQIAQSVYYNLEGIEVDDKTKRNIALGKEQIDNEALSTFFREASEGIVDYYLRDNKMQDEEIIVTQRDGCILTRLLRDNEFFIKMDLRDHINFMIITLDRKKFLYVSEQEVTIKGLANKYDALDKVFKQFAKLNFYNKKILFKQLQKIKDSIVEGEDLDFYTIVKGEKKLLITKKYGVVEIGQGIKLKTKDVDRERYYDLYFKEFMESLLLHFY